MRLKQFSDNAAQSFQNALNLKFSIGSICRNTFGSWGQKPLGDENETVCWESEKLFKIKLGHSKHFKKLFWSYLQVKKSQCSDSSKMTF